MTIPATALLSLMLHLAFGWQWTMLAGLLVGLARARAPLAVGGVGVAVGWFLLIGYNWAVAPRPTLRMLQFVGSLFGNLPAPAVVAVTTLLGGVLGLLGAWVGRQLILLRLAREREAIH